MAARSGQNPFLYDRPLQPDKVRGRDDLCDRLLQVVNRRGLATLVGPRRFGKTSVLGRVAYLSRQVDIDAVVRVDCYGVTSAGDFAARIHAGLRGLQGPARRAANALFAGSKVGLSLANPPVGLTAQLGAKGAPDPHTALHELLGNLTEISKKQGGLLLILDEFQDVGQVDGLDGLLRSHLQHAPEIAVLFAGSQPSLIRQLFADRSRPFYSQADIIEIQRFTRSEAFDIVQAGFDATGRDAGDAAIRIADETEGHPQRLMLAAHVAWEQVAPSETASDSTALAAVHEARRRAHHDVTSMIDGLDRTHRDTLRAVAIFDSPYARAAERALNLGRGSAQDAAERLVATGFLERTDDGWRVIDPFIAEALRSLDQEVQPPG